MNRMGGGTRVPSTGPRLNGVRWETRTRATACVSRYRVSGWGRRAEAVRALRQPMELRYRKSAVASILDSQWEGEQSAAQGLIVPNSKVRPQSLSPT